MTAALTFHGRADVAAEARARTVAHREADLLRAGFYGNATGPACSVGCLARDYGLETNDHAGLAAALGVPTWLILVQDLFFEGLHERDRAAWHVDLYAAIPVGLDDARLERVRAAWLHEVLMDPERGAVRRAHATRHAVEAVGALLARAAAGEAAAGWVEVASMAERTAAAWDEAAAWAAAWAARADATALAVEWASPRFGDEQAAYYRWMADRLLALLREAGAEVFDG